LNVHVEVIISETEMGVAPLMAPEHLTHPSVDEHSVMAYVNGFRTYDIQMKIAEMESLLGILLSSSPY